MVDIQNNIHYTAKNLGWYACILLYQGGRVRLLACEKREEIGCLHSRVNNKNSVQSE